MAGARRRRRKDASLQDMGLRAAGLGLVFLIIPSLFGASVVMKAVSSGLSFPGWLFLSAGLIMLGIAHLKKKAAPTASFVKQSKVSSKSVPLGDREKEVLVANIFRHAPAKASIPPDTRFGREAEKITANPPAKASGWSSSVFAAIEWRRFEAVCEALFAQAGFTTKSQSHGADGGVDIWLYSANAHGLAAVVQCKHWNGKAVGVKEMREFFGVMASHQLKRGTYATSATYTVDARKFAKDNGINALDGAALLGLIAKRTPEQQQDLLAIAHEGEYWRPTCASCGIKLVERIPAKGGIAFWGCSNFPRCKTRMQKAAAA